MLRAERDPSLHARITSITPLPGVRAGSALIFTGGRFLVVQDDALAVAWLDASTGAIEHVALEGDGAALAKPKKPDFESAYLDRDGTVVLLGSGSTPARHRAARLQITGGAELIDCTPLFQAVTASLGVTPNIEGVVLRGETLHLFHRGERGHSSAILEVPVGALGATSAEVTSKVWFDLGTAAGVSLAFTDATSCGDAIVYLAVAEDTPNAVDDGPIAGTAIGLISGDQARFTLLEESDGTPTIRKVEGIAIDRSTRTTFLVTDPDDPDRPAELCRVELEGFPLLPRSAGCESSGEAHRLTAPHVGPRARRHAQKPDSHRFTLRRRLVTERVSVTSPLVSPLHTFVCRGDACRITEVLVFILLILRIASGEEIRTHR